MAGLTTVGRGYSTEMVTSASVVEPVSTLSVAAGAPTRAFASTWASTPTVGPAAKYYRVAAAIMTQ